MALFQQLRGLGERTLVLARRPEILFAPVSWSGGAASFLVASAGEKTQALPGTAAPRGPLRDGRRPGDVARGLDAAFGFASQAGLSGCGLRWGGMGEVGFVQRLRGEVAPGVCHQWGSSSPTSSPPQTSPTSRLAEELINEAKLAEGVARKLLGDLAYRSKELREALAEVGILLSTEPSERRRGLRQRIRDLLFELEEGLWSRADAGDYPGRAGHQDRGEDLRPTPTPC